MKKEKWPGRSVTKLDKILEMRSYKTQAGLASDYVGYRLFYHTPLIVQDVLVSDGFRFKVRPKMFGFATEEMYFISNIVGNAQVQK